MVEPFYAVPLKRPEPCFWCGQLLDVGTRVTRLTITEDSGAELHLYYHPECYQAELGSNFSEDEPFVIGSFQRGKPKEGSSE